MHGHLAARARPARLRAGRRSRARPGHRQPHRRADAAHPGIGAARGGRRARRSPTRCRALRETYTGTIAYEIEHISDHEQRVWLRQAIESGDYRQPLAPEEKRCAARAAVRGRGARELPAQGLPGQEAVLDRGPRRARADARRDDRARRRGRRPRGGARAWPTAAASTCWRTPSAGPTSSILVEFEGEQTLSKDTAAPEGGTGDVKYHYGASGTYRTRERAQPHRHAVAQPEPPRVRQPGDRGPRARRPDQPQGARARPTTPTRCCRC